MEPIFVRLGVALGVGLLVGVQRERTEDSVAGVRTFPLITLVGGLCAELSMQLGAAWVFGAGLLGLVALLVTGNVMKIRAGDIDPGLTTEVAALYMFIVGGLIVVGEVVVGVVMGGLCAVLLHLKQPMEGLADRMSQREVKSVMQIAALGLVVLPVLPDRAYGPYGVLNPFEIWLMVVLIVGISLASYLLYKLLGARAGTLLGGVLGGLISSTATTASYARRAKGDAAQAPQAALVVMVASTVVYARIFVEVAAAAPTVLAAMAPPIAVVAAANVLICFAALPFLQGGAAELPEHDAPAEFKAALLFGALYGVVIFAVAAAQDKFGDMGLYVVALVSGLTDVDAITLSAANLAELGQIETDASWRAIVLASLANLAFKGGLAGVLGGRALFARLLPLFGASIGVGVAVLLLWP